MAQLQVNDQALTELVFEGFKEQLKYKLIEVMTKAYEKELETVANKVAGQLAANIEMYRKLDKNSIELHIQFNNKGAV